MAVELTFTGVGVTKPKSATGIQIFIQQDVLPAVTSDA